MGTTAWTFCCEHMTGRQDSHHHQPCNCWKSAYSFLTKHRVLERVDAAVTVTLRERFPLEGGCLLRVSLPLASLYHVLLSPGEEAGTVPRQQIVEDTFFFPTVASGHLVFWQETQDDLKMVSFLPQIFFFPSNT